MNVKLKDFLKVFPDSTRIMFCEYNCNGDVFSKSKLMYVGEREKYSTHMEKRIQWVEVHGKSLAIFLKRYRHG